MFFIIEIPIIMILLVALGIVSALDDIIPLVGQIIKWTILLNLAFFTPLTEVVLYSGEEKQRKVRRIIRGILHGIAIVLLFLFAEQVFESAFQNWGTYILFFIAYLLFCVLLVLVEKIGLGYVLFLLCFLWTIGYDLSFNVKQFESNAVYVEYVGRESHIYSVSRMPEENESFLYGRCVFDGIYESEYVDKSHVLEDITEGDKYYIEKNAVSEDGGWLAVKVSNTTGYIYDEGLKRYYNRTSEEIVARQQEQIQARWYKIIPTPVLNVSEFLYEHSGPLCRVSFAE